MKSPLKFKFRELTTVASKMLNRGFFMPGNIRHPGRRGIEHHRKLCQGLALVMISSLLVSCTASHPIPPYRDNIQQNVTQGTKVRVVTRDAQTQVFVVKEITENGLYGEGAEIAYQDIESIESEEISAGKTATFILLGVGAVVLFGFYVASTVSVGTLH